MTTFIGLFAGVLLATSGIPQAVSVIRQGHTKGLALHTILMIIAGMASLATYVYLQHGFDPILHIEYAITVGVWSVCLKYFFWPRRNVLVH